MGGSQSSKDPSVNQKADDRRSVQFPEPPLSTESLKSRTCLKSKRPPLDFKERSSHISCTSETSSVSSVSIKSDNSKGHIIDSSVKPEGSCICPGLIHHHFSRSSYPPSCTSETSSVSGVSIKSDNSKGHIIDSSVNSIGPSVNPKADVRRSVQPPDPPKRDEVRLQAQLLCDQHQQYHQQQLQQLQQQPPPPQPPQQPPQQ